MSKLKIIIFILCSLVAIPVFCFSQPSGERLGTGRRQWRGENQCWRALDLNLSPDQVRGLDLINETYVRETQPLRTELFSKRLELRQFLTNPTIKIESIRAKNLEVTEIESKLDGKVVEYLIKVRTLLTPDQLRLWCPEQEFPFLRGMMERFGPMRPITPRMMPFPER